MRRTPAGFLPVALVCAVWAFAIADPAQADPVSFVAASADGSHVLFQTEGSLVGSDTDDAIDLYMRADGRTVLPASGPGAPAGAGDASFANISADGSRLFFFTSEALVPEDTDADSDIYEFSGGAVSLLPGGADFYPMTISADNNRVFGVSVASLDSADTDSEYDVYLLQAGAFSLLTPGTTSHTNFHAVSDDGDHLYLSTRDQLTPDAEPDGGVFERAAGAYRAVAPGPCPTNTGCSNNFDGISADGTRAFLTTNRALLPADNDIYSDVYTDTGAGPPILVGHPSQGVGFNEYVANSADGQRVLIRSAARLTADDHDYSTDLYLWWDGELTLVSGGRQRTDQQFASGTEFAGASSDLSHVLFLTDVGLVPSDTGEDDDLYEWIDGRLRIVSNLPKHLRYTYPTNSRIAADGSVVYFESDAALVKADRDDGDQDVYGYDNSTRDLYLVNRDPGFRTRSQPARILDASADDSVVLFLTNQRMVGADRDLNSDIYQRRGKSISLVSQGVGAPVSEARFGTLGTAPGANGPIVFTRRRYCDPDTDYCGPGLAGIYTVTADGQRPRRIIEDPTADDPAFSRDGRWIVFESRRDGDSEIYLMRPDGTEVTQVTDDPAGDSGPEWLSDGRIVFTSDRDGDPDLYAVNADGNGLVGIGETVGAASTDGRRIAAAECPRRNACDIYLYRPNGERIKRLTKAPGDDYEPVFSPDGKRIAFISRRNGGADGRGGSREVYVMRSNGSGQRRITRPSERTDRDVAVFSPDSRQLLFQSSYSSAASSYSSLQAVNLRSGKLRLIPGPEAGGIDSAADWQSLPQR